MAVKRYHDSVGAKRLHERPDGEFVRHEDYAALELRLEAAESALSDDGVYGDHNLIPSYEMEISQLKKEILTLHAFCKPEDLSAAYLAIGSESGIHSEAKLKPECKCAELEAECERLRVEPFKKVLGL